MKHALIYCAALTLALSCSQEPGGLQLQYGMDYSSEMADHTQYIYVFALQGVSVYAQVLPNGEMPPRKPDGSIDAMAHVVRLPILENAPYKIDGTTLTIDWSQNHTKYLPLDGKTNTTEVFTIETGGYTLKYPSNPEIYLSEQT